VTSAEAVTVGVDIGTTSVKAVAVTADGDVVARSRVRHALTADAERLRHDARRAWMRGPRRAVDLLGDVRPVAVSVTGMVPSMTAVDRRGRPRSPGLLYGDELGRATGGDGNPQLVGDAPQFLRALAREHPDAAGYWPAQTLAGVAIGGQPAVSATLANVMHPLALAGRWDESVLAGCGVAPERMPRIVADHEPVGRIEGGPLDGALLDGGGIDVMCERLVSGPMDDGDVVVLCGSTLILFAVRPAGGEPPASILAYPDETGRLTATTASNAGGLFLDWVDRTLAKPSRTASVSPDLVPVWSPYIRGERTPWQDPSRRAALVDVHLGHDAAAVRRAAFEASGFVVRHLLELLDVAPRRIAAVGGGSRSDGWMQALADCVGARVDAATEPEGAAIGAAYLARMAAGLERDGARAERWARPVRRFEPDADWVTAVGERYRRFRELAERGAGTASTI
jgi:xylulokinase